MNNPNCKKNERNKGYTLVELMLAMTLGIFLIAGVGTVYMSSKQTYETRDQVSELDENARVALRALRHHIAHAGYASVTGMPVPDYIIPAGATITPASCSDGSMNVVNANSIRSSSDGNYSPGGGGDSIGLAYLADESLHVDCSDSALKDECLPPNSIIRESRMVYSSFFSRRSQTVTTNNVGDPVPELSCGGSRRTAPWAQGVENIQFMYGVDADGDLSVDRYLNATNVQSQGAWGQIISVRAGLLIRSLEPVFERAQSESFQVLDEVITTNDRYKRGVYTTTIRLKNVARRSR